MPPLNQIALSFKQPDVRFVVDAQLPTALARVLVAKGYEAQHVSDVAPGDTPDDWIWDFALANNSAIITKDSDFPDIAALRPVAPPIVWIRLGNTRKQELLDWFVPQLDSVVNLAEKGTGIIELR